MFDVQIKVSVDPEDVLDELSDQDILDYLKDNRELDVDEGITNKNDSRRLPPQNLREKLCDMFDLAAMSPKEDIIEYIKTAI